MSYADIAIVAALFLFVVFTLVAFGMGHKRWSIVSVVATFLVTLTIPTFFYFSAILLHHEWRWAQAARTLQEKIAFVRDAKQPSADKEGPAYLVKVADRPSIRELEETRDRWERALTRTDNWRGRHWTGASFSPPAADGQTGTVTLPAAVKGPDAPPDDGLEAAAPPVDAGAAEGGDAAPADAAPADAAPADAAPAADAAPPAAAPAADAASPAAAPAAAGDAPAPADATAGAAPPDVAAGDAPAAEAAPARQAAAPIDPGTTIYVFDDTPYAAGGGGNYLGAFLVQSVDTVDGRQALTVQQTAPRDAYDTKVWSRAYEAVSVYTELPSDRWLAFSETHGTPPETEPSDTDAKIAPPARKRASDILDALVPELASGGEGMAKYMNFRERVKQHSLSASDVPEAIDEAQWPDLRERLARGDAIPGEYWAEVTYNDRADMEAFLGVAPEDLGDHAGASIEMELASAFAEKDADKLTIDKVFYRRPLMDAQTLIHGIALPGDDGSLVSDGLAALRLVLRREIAALEIAKTRLDTGLKQARAELDIVSTQKRQSEEDLQQWSRDVTAATRLADRFEAEANAAASRLAETERQIVELGQGVVSEMGKAVQDVDQVAPPAGARGAAAAAAPF